MGCEGGCGGRGKKEEGEGEGKEGDSGGSGRRGGRRKREEEDGEGNTSAVGKHLISFSRAANTAAGSSSRIVSAIPLSRHFSSEPVKSSPAHKVLKSAAGIKHLEVSLACLHSLIRPERRRGAAGQGQGAVRAQTGGGYNYKQEEGGTDRPANPGSTRVRSNVITRMLRQAHLLSDVNQRRCTCASARP